VETGGTRFLAQGLAEGTLDVAIMPPAEAPERDLVSVRVAWEFPIVMVTAAPHIPLRCSLQDLAPEPFIFFRPASHMQRVIDQYLAQFDLHPRVTMRFDNVDAVKEMLKLGAGVSMMPQWAIDPELAGGALRVVQTGIPPLRSQVVVAVRRGGYLPAAAEALVDIARDKKFTWLAKPARKPRNSPAGVVRKTESGRHG
jgi:DNA-binding transcriptional LysR family regulator